MIPATFFAGVKRLVNSSHVQAACVASLGAFATAVWASQGLTAQGKAGLWIACIIAVGVLFREAINSVTEENVAAINSQPPTSSPANPANMPTTTTPIVKILLWLFLPALMLVGMGCGPNDPLTVVGDTSKPTLVRLAAADQLYVSAGTALVFAKQTGVISQSEWNKVVVPANNAFQSAMNALQTQAQANPLMKLDGNSIWTLLQAALTSLINEKGTTINVPTSQPTTGPSSYYSDKLRRLYVADSCYRRFTGSHHNCG
jgi:hypothetical protein